MTLHTRDAGADQPSHSSARDVKPLLHYAKRFAAHINDTRRMAGSMAISAMLGAGVLLSGCAAAPAYDSASVYEDDDLASGFFGFDSWGWHSCDCGTFGQLDRTEPKGEY
jgi:hypothetical protein